MVNRELALEDGWVEEEKIEWLALGKSTLAAFEFVVECIAAKKIVFFF